MPVVDAFAKGVLSKLIAQIYKRYQTTETSVMLDKLKDLGFKYSTLSGISIAISDIKESQKKPEIIANSQALVDQVNKQFKRGLITDEERYQKVVAIWTDTKKYSGHAAGVVPVIGSWLGHHGLYRHCADP